MPQFLTLAVLVKSGQHCSMATLAEATHQDAATMTGVVDRLERLALAARTRSQVDRRVILVAPSARGVALVNAVKESRELLMGELFLAFDDQALRDLNDHLERLWQALEARARSC